MALKGPKNKRVAPKALYKPINPSDNLIFLIAYIGPL